MRKYTIVDSPADNVIGLPPSVMEALGHPTEVEAEVVPEGLLLKASSRRIRMGSRANDPEAMRAFRASLPPDAGFTDEELEALRRERKELAEREAAKVLALFQDLDKPDGDQPASSDALPPPA